MIKFEGTTLVITGDLSSEDVKAIQHFADHQRKMEKESILKRLQDTLEGYETVTNFDYFWTMREVVDIINDEYIMRTPKIDKADLVELQKTRFNADELLVD